MLSRNESGECEIVDALEDFNHGKGMLASWGVIDVDLSRVKPMQHTI
jgi:hypothetical protein